MQATEAKAGEDVRDDKLKTRMRMAFDLFKVRDGHRQPGELDRAAGQRLRMRGVMCTDMCVLWESRTRKG